jgi:DNA modification methylase
MSIKILEGNCLQTLSSLEEKSVNTCVTSPPYWGLRDYGTAKWIGGDPNCSHMRTTKINKNTSNNVVNKAWSEGNVGDAIYKSKCSKCGAVREDDQLGLEETPEQFVENLVKVFQEVRRVLRDDGTVWLNLGDSYCGTGHKGDTIDPRYQGRNGQKVALNNKIQGLKQKDLVGIPWRVAFALQADGWYLRQDIIWSKPNPMPESVQDRCTKAHEYIFLLSKSSKYYYDSEAIKEEIQDESAKRLLRGVSDNHKNSFGAPGQTPHTMNKPRKNVRKQFTSDMEEDGTLMIGEKRNKRSVWTVTTKPYSEAHFATYPPELIKPCILAGCPEKVCANCGKPYVRGIESTRLKRNELPKNDPRYRPNTYEGTYKNINGKADAGYTQTKDLGLQKQCQCETNETKSGTVLDPFGGSGTTAQVANNLNRNAILCELNPEYVEIAKGRLHDSLGMFMDLEVVK